MKNFIYPTDPLNVSKGPDLRNLWPVLLLFSGAIGVWMPLSHTLHAVVILTSAFMFIKHRPGYIATGLEIPFAVLVGAWLLACLVSPEPAKSIVYMKKLTPYLLLFLLPNLRLTQAAKKRLLTVWLTVTLIHSLWVVGQYVMGQNRPGGLFGTGGYMHFAHFVYIPMAVCLSLLFLTAGKGFKRFIFAVLAAGAMALFATYTRGAWIALAGGMLLFFLIKKKWVWIISLLLVLITFASVVLVVMPKSKLGKTVSSIVEPFDSSNTRVAASNRPRLLMWKASLDMAKDHPVFGVGPLRYQEELPGYLPDVPADEDIDYTHAHSVYLDTAATLGIVGLIGLLIFLGALFYVLTKAYFRAEGVFEKTLLLAGIIGAVCLCLGGLTEMTFRRAQSALNLCFVIGLALGAAASHDRAQERDVNQPGSSHIQGRGVSRG